MGKPTGDITPGHLPVALLRAALEKAEEMDAMAGAVVLVSKISNEDRRRFWYDACGHENWAVLWAIEQMRMEVLDITQKDGS